MRYYIVSNATHYVLVKASSMVTALTRGARALIKEISNKKGASESLHAENITEERYKQMRAELSEKRKNTAASQGE